MPGVDVLVPWRPGCPHRERAWDWVRAQYGRVHPDWKVVQATAPDGEWCKAAGVHRAALSSCADVVLVADADVFCDGLGEAVSHVIAGAPWAMPHNLVHRLDEASSVAFMDGAPRDGLSTVERPYRGVPGGGVVVLPRETLLRVPLDPRFLGWGQEDVSFATALNCLAGRPWRGDHDLVHLYHPPQPRMSRKNGNPHGVALRRRYALARGNANHMLEIVEEAQACLSKLC